MGMSFFIVKDYSGTVGYPGTELTPNIRNLSFFSDSDQVQVHPAAMSSGVDISDLPPGSAQVAAYQSGVRLRDLRHASLGFLTICAGV
jgi:hypothetical protein